MKETFNESYSLAPVTLTYRQPLRLSSTLNVIPFQPVVANQANRQKNSRMLPDYYGPIRLLRAGGAAVQVCTVQRKGGVEC